MKSKTSKRISGTSRKREAVRELAPEYLFDYSKSKKNRFARRMRQSVTVVVLDPDVAKAFPTPESVNRALRRLATRAAEKATGTKKARKQPA